MKRTMLAILTIGGLLLPLAIGRPQVAHAESDCLMGQVDVNGTASRHDYKFSLACPDGPSTFRLQVAGEYDVNAKRATEKLTGDRGIVEAIWDQCTGDPWIAAAPDCSRTNVFVQAAGETSTSTGGGSCLLVEEIVTVPGAFLGELTGVVIPTVPCSVQLLAPYEVDALNAQLQNALNQKPATPAPNPAAHPIDTKAGNGTEPCFACPGGIAGIPSTRPDLAVTVAGKTSLYSGMMAVYTVTIKNQGAPLSGDPVVQVAIAFNGNLQYYATADTGAFTCTPGATINCTGHLDASGQATLIFQGYAKAAGSGTVQATVDPSQAIPDSNRSNNSQSLTVTVS